MPTHQPVRFVCREDWVQPIEQGRRHNSPSSCCGGCNGSNSAEEPENPLKHARGLAEAADAGLVLTTDDLIALGVKGVDGFADDDEAFGYRFSKHRQRNRTLWTVERSIGKAKPSYVHSALLPEKGE